MKKLMLIITITIFFQQCSFNQEVLINESIPLKEMMDSLKLQNNLVFIEIDKSDYKLSVRSNDLIIKEYPVVFGGNPVDDKRMEGDQCTPEGEFKVLSKYPHKSWSKFIWIDYPNDQSRINFDRAKAEGVIPEVATIGGEIGIHGVPANYEYAVDLQYNWTLGCVSLKNTDVDEIYEIVEEGMLVVIHK